MKPIEYLTEIPRAKRLKEIVQHGWALEPYDREKITEILVEWIDILEAEKKGANQ